MAGTKDFILRSEKVTVSFDGFKAVSDMEMEVKKGELRFLIGPNGAGKTTFLDVICGKVKPESGKIIFYDGTDITKRKEHQIASLGIGRKFQAPSIFNSLSVVENLELAMKQKRGILSTLFAKLTREDMNRLEESLSLIGLTHKSAFRAGSLSHGEKQWLEIGMMIIQDPTLLLLDEPVAGMTDKETEKTGEMLQEIVKERTVVVVEHDMDFVRQFSSKVTVMHEGRLL